MRFCYVLIILMIVGCQPAAENDQVIENDMVSTQTQIHNQQITRTLALSEGQDFEQAKRGLLVAANDVQVTNADGEIIWDNPAFKFIKGAAPASVNPSLWRQESLNNLRGLFKVTEGVYQLRGFDLANMTLIESDTGWIIVDPLTATETAQAAFEFAQRHLGEKPIRGIIFTHPHIDHFGGVLGLVSPQDIKNNEIDVIAPEGFLEHATSENVLVGVAMARRSSYMYGKDLPRHEQGFIGSGLGTSPAFGTFTIVKPTRLISDAVSKMAIDGVEFIFHNVSGSEAEAELTFYLPKLKAFAGAELVSRNMHNLYTLRGAQIRDAHKWSRLIEQAAQLASNAEVYFGSHHWPIWGQQNIQSFLLQQSDLYQFIHDQSVRLINQGLNGEEIAEQIRLPDALAASFSNRGYYGALSQNAKAVYQYYMGWYDANPANLNKLPHTDTASRYVELMGGSEALLNKTQQLVEQGDYRWAAELLNHVVFAESDNQRARALLAYVYQQLGFQSESAPWRNVYLSGAQELHQGVSDNAIDLSRLASIFMHTPVENFFQSLAVRLNPDDAAGKQSKISIRFTDLDKQYQLSIRNSVLKYKEITESQMTENRIDISHPMFISMLTGQAGIKDILLSDNITYDGSLLDLIAFLRLFEQPIPQFNIVTP